LDPRRETKSTFAPSGHLSFQPGAAVQRGSDTRGRSANIKCLRLLRRIRVATRGPAAATVCFGMSFSRPVRRLRSLITPSLGPLITPPKYTDYTALKSITNVVGGVIVARPPGPHQDPNKTKRPQQDTKTPASPKTPARHQDPSKTPRPPARPKNLARKRVLTRSVRQVGSET
jgi:hypothetical protein